MDWLGIPEKYRGDIAADLKKMLCEIFLRKNLLPISTVYLIGPGLKDLVNELQAEVQLKTARGNLPGQTPLNFFNLESMTELKKSEDFSDVLLIEIFPENVEFDFPNLKHRIILAEHCSADYLMRAGENQWFFELGRCLVSASASK